ncbi:ImmA/IrrE family metallo-endopeptidase [Gulosibacter hominis]|uniref:ImmA/IrrE family metallo-endopeptidase n=1 Tax=Gulosibacter hominis TaxID=2770504 RepID=UPI001917A690|nr:hypothetical protein [Gulosibacter hominis]
MFDPHEHAHETGVTVDHIPGLPDLGRYYPHHRHIQLRADLTWIEERCVLTHELGHHRYGHHQSTPRTEREADQWAANRLITIDAIVECARIWPHNPEKWCHHLAVTPAILRAWLSQPHNYQAASQLLTHRNTP